MTFVLPLLALLLAGNIYPHRWVWVSRNLSRDQDVEDIRGIAETAARHGLTGMALSCGLDRLSLQSAAYVERVRRVKEICDGLGLEIIPNVFSVGYGGSLLAFDRNLAEGQPVKDALFVADGRTARLEPDPAVAFVNGGLEEYDGHKLKGYSLQDGPGSLSYIDTETFAEGASSLRFEKLETAANGNARLMQMVPVRPYRCYRVSFWVRTRDLEPAGAFRLQVLAPDTTARALAPWTAGVAATAGWRKLVWGFNSGPYDRVRIYAGTWGARGGAFWLDGFEIEETGLLNVLRRPGTPVEVRGEESGTVYQEGGDYGPIVDPRLNHRFDHEAPPLALTAGTRIRPGERLRVSWYHSLAVNDGQVTVCMSEPRIYEIFREQARRMHELLGAGRYILSMDEIRAGGTCEACRRRGLSMAEILGDCITRQMEALRDANPGADIYSWSDMLDPNHNAHGNYYLVDGDYSGSWNYVPPDLGIITWYYLKRAASLEHFSSLGFRTLAGAYYDGDTLENPRGWLEALDRTPGAVGIMYTTWQNKYKLLADFGDLVSRE
ncbi:MAG: hypothetical protein ACE15B_15415 [Bryobacteraceae bacterium]